MRLIFIPILKRLLSRGSGEAPGARAPDAPSPPDEADVRPRHDGPEVLFICTGNYYRSRFAEAVFNHLAASQGLPWRAFSRGLDPDGAPPGLSPHARNGLRLAGIDPALTSEDRHRLREEDFDRAALVVALKEDEHRPMLEADFPARLDQVTFWDVADIADLAPQTALLMIKEHVEALIGDLPAVAPQ